MTTYRIKLKPEGKDVFTGVLPFLDRDFKGGIRAAALQISFNLVKTGKDGIQREKKLGRFYKRKGKRKRRASAGGQYPGIVTGQTLRGIDAKVRGDREIEFGIEERQDGPRDLPKWLEEGTSKMEPRPTLGNANRDRQKDIENYLRHTPLDRMTRK